MVGIAGIAQSGKRRQVKQMLDKIKHRGPAGREIIELKEATLGIVWTKNHLISISAPREEQMVCDEAGDERFARAQVVNGKLVLERDQLGVAPLYYGRTVDDSLCFASEIKAMLEVTSEIYHVPPGHSYNGKRMIAYFQLPDQSTINDSPEVIAKELRQRLDTAVIKRINQDSMGVWLSGGIDSSILAALARPYVNNLYTFVAGFKDSPDVEYARQVADHIKSNHHEVIVTFDELVSILPRVIYQLESFDALLVRSSVTNYLVSQYASKYVSEVFSGECADTLFAGLARFKSLPPDELAKEIEELAGQMHNSSLQRVDRFASAFGTIAHVPFADPEVVDYAFRIPVEYKIANGVEKWILRQAAEGLLPKTALYRTKSKFWEGAGVCDLFARHAEQRITDNEFMRERTLSNGWTINSKEELLYYRIFKYHFGNLPNLSWMGRTKGAPCQAMALTV